MKIKKLTETAIIPTRGSKEAAGFDLYADSVEGDFMRNGDEIMYPENTSIKIHTGIAMAIPDGYVGLIFPRSGLSTKQGLRLANCVGVIDSDYRGEVIVCMHNDKINGNKEEKPAQIKLHDRIAQIVIIPYIAPEMEEVDSLDETERGTGGFGSTGTN